MASLQAIVHREGLRIRILEFHSAPFKGVHLSAVANNQDGATDGQFNYIDISLGDTILRHLLLPVSLIRGQ